MQVALRLARVGRKGAEASLAGLQAALEEGPPRIVCKPQAEAYARALRIAGADARSTLFFDDSLRNIGAGKAAGLATVLVSYPRTHAHHVVLTQAGGGQRSASAASASLVTGSPSGPLSLLSRLTRCAIAVLQVGRREVCEGADLALPSVHELPSALPSLWPTGGPSAGPPEAGLLGERAPQLLPSVPA